MKAKALLTWTQTVVPDMTPFARFDPIYQI
jgi:uncharacterized membrane protein